MLQQKCYCRCKFWLVITYFKNQFAVIMHCLCSTVVGIRGKSGVILGVERLVQSKLYEDDANKRIFHIDVHIGMVRQVIPF